MRALGRALNIAGGLFTVIGLNNIFAGCQLDDLSHTAFLVMLNGFVLVLPGAALAAIGGALRNAGRDQGFVSHSYD